MTSLVQPAPTIKSQRRAALSRHPELAGIDYIEVRQLPQERWDLLVHFVPVAPEVPDKPALPAGITQDNIVIRGRQGTPNPGIQLLSVSYPETGGNVLTVAVAALEGRNAVIGSMDFPAYTLELVHLTGIDRFFSSATFTFDVSAPSDFHPAPSGIETPRFVSTAQIDYLAKDYESFRRLMLDRLSLQVPQWTERNPTDLGMALVELLAYAADYLSYHQDAVATEAYIGTARRRVSVARHARLLDYYLHQGCNARVWVHAQVAADTALEAGTPLLTSVASQASRIPTQFYDQALQQGPRVFETMHPVKLFEAHNRMTFYTWGAAEYSLPPGATRATLKGHYPNLKAGDVLIFEEVAGRATGRPVDVDVRRRQAVLLDVPPRLELDPLQNNAEVTEIEWSDQDALPFAFHVSAYSGSALLQDISIARGNVVLADHGQTIDQEHLPAVPEQGKYRPRLQRSGLTYRSPYDADRALSQGASGAMLQRPQDARPAIALFERPAEELVVALEAGGERAREWAVCRDLVRSSPFAREFKVEVEDDGSAYLLFGDGAPGRRPEAGSLFTARYRIGNGPQGNVGRDTVVHVVSNDDSILGVRNPLPAQGGAGPESVEEARLYAPQSFYVQERCVTEDDYVVIAERHPEVQKAAAVIRWSGSWHTVFIFIDRYNGRPVDEEFKRSFGAYLDKYRMSGYDLEVSPPHFVPLDIALTVFVEPGHFRPALRQNLTEVFSNGVLPDGQRGFFHPDNLTFGQNVYLSHVVTRVAQAPGVMRVDVDRFRHWGEAADSSLVVNEIETRPFEVARLDNDPSAPWNGTIRFNVVGGW